MASETGHTEIPLKENEVLLYKDGKPVLRVEKGTPLSVIKMLYNADPKNKGTVVAALRPRTDESLPCLVTLDKSTLSQDKYDIVAFEQPKPSQRIQDYQVGQPIITMGPNGQVHGATVIPAGWPVNTTGLTYAPVNQLLQNHTASHVAISSANSSKTTLMHVTTPMSYASPVISNVMSNANLGAIGGVPQGTYTNIVPRKSPLTLKPVSTPSRRKRSSHKTAYPRKITLVVPDNATESPGINVKKFLYPKPITRTARTNSDDAQRIGTDETSSVVVCDSTAGNGHDNGRLSSEGTPSPPKDERGRLLQPPNCHQQIHESSSPSWEQSGHDGHPIYHNQRSDGSSPEHDSSLEEGDGHAVMVDSDEKESFSAGNDSDTGMTATQSGIASLSDNRQLFRSSNIRIEHVEATDGNGSHYPSRSRNEVVPENYRSDDENEENDPALQFPTAIVRLENTVRVKAEPLDRNNSPSSGASCNNAESNGVLMATNEGASGRASNSLETESSNFLSTSSVRGLMENDGVSGMPPMHPGTPGISTGLHSSLTPYPPNYPRTTGDGVAFRCEQCQKEFDTSAALERHKRSHSGERPYKCKICGWGFNLSGNLNQHMAIHQKVKPFKCVYCGKTFARSNVLKAHVRCHTGERPYQCDLCGAKFIIPHNLKKHLLNRHQVVWEERRWSSGKAES